MLKPEFIQTLKRVNVSKNPEVTKERIRAAWEDKSKRDEILSTSGQQKSAVAKAYKDGTVTPRLVISMAQVLGINPAYLTGDCDEQGEYSDDIAKEFLTSRGFEVGKGDFVVTRKKRAKNTDDTSTPKAVVTENEPAPAPAPAPVAVDAPAACSTNLSDCIDGIRCLAQKEMCGKIENITQEDLVQLLNSLSIQSAYSAQKKNLLDLIKCLLLM